MTAVPTDSNGADELDELRRRAEILEQELAELRRTSDSRLILAEMKSEAIRAGMLDLDGLKLLDMSTAHLNEKGEIENASGILMQFRKAKPWLFGMSSSSGSTPAPQAQSPRPKHATEMTNEEYIAARAAVIKQRY